MQKKYTYIDLFSGCGGLSLGLLNAGWKGLFAVEKNPDAFSTLKYNLIHKQSHYNWPKWLPVSHHNIDHVLSQYNVELKKLKGFVDLVAGGPPCQGFSVAGQRKEDDCRNKLIDSYLKFVSFVEPTFIFFENVKGFTLSFGDNAKKGKNYSDYVIRRLDLLGYNVHGKLVDFSEYGIPQKRTRFILIGVKKSFGASGDLAEVFFDKLRQNRYLLLSLKGLSTEVTLEEAISDLLESHGTAPCPDSEDFKSGLYSTAQTSYQRYMRCRRQKNSIPDSHRFVNHSQKIKERFQYAIDNNLGPKEYQRYFKLSKSGTKKVLRDEPSSTLTTLPDDYIHYQEPRVFTVREFARIQSFPDWYEFKGNYTTGGKLRTKQTPRYTQIGNAIPPLFAEIAGFSLKEMASV
ncbi:MAG: DNA cytosine methyltransferase [Desulfobacteraceae bacterium]|nr:DNA cytosine methyltransferase [Desulfobacteraceae bacterium]